MHPSLFVFIALPCEARPLIRNWRLKKHPQKHPFGIYCNDEIAVVVSGIGKIAMAGAVGYALSLFPNTRHPLLLNLGIAGHRQHSLGSLYLADKIVDTCTGKKFYPQQPFAIACETAAVATQAVPQSDYAGDCLYDMEAAAFYEMACKFSSMELVHSLKIVSDNAQSPLADINEAAVTAWIEAKLPKIEELLAEWVRLRQSLPVAGIEPYRQLCERFRFTVANQVKLRSLLERWRIVTDDAALDEAALKLANGKDLLAWLEKNLESREFHL